MGATGEAHQSLLRNQKSQSKAAVTHGCALAQTRPRLDNEGHVLSRAVSQKLRDCEFI